MAAVMGIDPGVNGGIAVLDLSGAVLYVRALNPKMTQRELAGPHGVVGVCADVMRAHQSRDCFAEKVGYMPGDGGKGSNTFGRVDGLLRGAAWMAGLEVFDVSPMIWQTRLGCLTGGNKNVSKNLALVLFPGEKITHNIADALLIAEFGRRTLLRKSPATARATGFEELF